MTLDPFSSPSPDADLPSGIVGKAVRAAASGDTVVTAQETEHAWQVLQARMAGMARESATVVGTIAPAASAPAVRRKPQWWSYAAAALLTVGAVGLWQRLSPARDVVNAPLGQRVAVTLPDGSSITLAAGSTASWVRGFRGGAREIMLDGEAFFDVVHDDQRPFLVRARDGVAQDVGTRFIVRAWPELAQVEVAVEDGIVAFADSAAARTKPVSQRVQLHAGQRGRLAGDGSVAVRRADSAAFSWLTGTLAFADAPANEAIAVIGRWYGVQIAVDPTLASRRLTARFVSQPLPQLLDALALALGAKVERRGMQITLTP
jgi:transmembrane sensor